jgi:hypothetical protein
MMKLSSAAEEEKMTVREEVAAVTCNKEGVCATQANSLQ